MTGIVILNFNNYPITKECVESILKHEDRDKFKICLVDNSTDVATKKQVIDFVDRLKCKYSCLAIHLLLLDKNEGYARGNNEGIRYFEGDETITHILILNNDIILTMPILESLNNYLEEHLNCAVASVLLYDKDGKIDFTCARREKNLVSLFARVPLINKIEYVRRKNVQHEYILKDKLPAEMNLPIDINLPSGSCMMLRKNFFKEIGYFDPNTFLYFEEDILWSKIKKRNMESILLPCVSCVHLGASTIGEQSKLIISKHYYDSMMYYFKQYSNINGFLLWIVGKMLSLKMFMIKKK